MMLHEFHVLAVSSYKDTMAKLVSYLKDENIQEIPKIDQKIIRIHTVLKDLLSDY